MEQFIFVTIILIIFIFYNIKKKRDLLLPENLFTIVILSTYAIACLGFSNLQHEYKFSYTIVILIFILSFYLGAHIKLGDKNTFTYNYNEKKLKISVYVLFTIVLSSFLIMCLKLGPPPLISKQDRATYFLSGVGTVYLMIDVLSFLIIFDLFDKKIIGKKSYIMLAIILAMIILMSNKFQIIYFACQYLVLYNIMKKKIKLVTLLKLVVVALVIFIIYYNFIYNGMYISNDEMYTVNQMNFSQKYSLLTNPYLYVAFNYENIYNYMKLDSVTYGFGYYTFEEILDAINLKELLIDNNELLINQWKNNLQYPWLTTGTIFREFYMDFGYPGTCLMMMVLGIICHNSYKRCYTNKSIFYIYLYATNMVSIFLAFFTNNFISINYIINLLCAYIISKYCFKKS